jgi:competence ComEA-like helix-hairpin-helix protein
MEAWEKTRWFCRFQRRLSIDSPRAEHRRLGESSPSRVRDGGLGEDGWSCRFQRRLLVDSPRAEHRRLGPLTLALSPEYGGEGTIGDRRGGSTWDDVCLRTMDEALVPRRWGFMTGSIIGWPTESQRRGGVWILLTVAGVLGVWLLRDRETIADPQPAVGVAAGRLADRVDPNVASEAELAAVPGVGERKAAAMVAYREAYGRSHQGSLAFDNAGDLQNVSGIGETTAENIEPYLMLPNERSVSLTVKGKKQMR